jgi:protocatechuate 3,4-dioxygenase beta subunit
MRSRALILSGAGVAAVIAVAFVWLRGGSSSAPAATPHRGVAPAGANVVPATESAQPSLRFDDDPSGTLRLEGQVIDGADHPIAGATVVIDANPPREVQTEGDGSFAFRDLAPRAYRVAARAGDASAGPVSLQLTATTEAVILRMRPSAKIAVAVRAEDGKPVAGALVELRDLAAITAISDDKGVATLRGVGAGRHTLKVSAEGYASTFVDTASSGEHGYETHLDVTLRAGAAIAGIVVDPSGAPVEGAKVLPESLSRWGDGFDARLDAVLTDAKGRWRLTGLPRETMRVRAYHAEFAPAASPPILLAETPSREGVTIMLDRGAKLRGRVVDGTGAPVAGAEIRVATGGLSSGPLRRASADAKGEFAITGLPRRMIYLLAASAGATSPTAEVDLATGDKPAVTLKLAFASGIAGVVVTSTGAPVSEARVEAYASASQDPSRFDGVDDRLRGATSVIADIEGRFKLSGLAPGNYHLRAIRPGSSPQLMQAKLGIQVAAGATDARVVVDDLSTLTGRVVYPDGSSPARFAIALGTSPASWFSAKDGAFRIEEVPTGTQFVRVSGMDFVPLALPDVAIASGKATDLGSITVQAGRAISGSVVDRGGHPVGGATVYIGRELTADGASLAANARPDLIQVATADDGTFTARGVGPGNHTIAADHEVAGRSTTVELPAGTTDQTLMLTLQPPGAIQGFVRSAGKPADALIILRAQSAANLQLFVSTGPDGSYRIDRVAPGRYVHFAVIESQSLANGTGGSGKQIEVKPGETLNVDVDLTPSGVSVVVRLTSPGDVVKFGYAVLGMADMTKIPALPKTISEARTIAANLDSVDLHEGLIVDNQQIKFDKVTAGQHVLCAAPMRGDPRDPAVIAELQKDAVDWPIYCRFVDVATAPDPQLLTAPVQPVPPRK